MSTTQTRQIGGSCTRCAFSTDGVNLKAFRKILFDPKTKYGHIFNDGDFLVIALGQEERVRNQTVHLGNYCKFPLKYKPKDLRIYLDSSRLKTVRTFFYALGTKITESIQLEAWFDNGSDFLIKFGLTENLLVLKYPKARTAPIEVHINEVGRLDDHFGHNFIRNVKMAYDYDHYETEEIK